MYNTFFRQCPFGAKPYIIKPGDTFYRLALQFNTTIPAIRAVNPGVNPLFLNIGQQICIPALVPTSCPEGNPYTIKPGDTLYAIARFFNISLDDLIEANRNVDPNRLFIGQVICIPLATPPVTCPLGIFPYIVQRGDTFYSIANKFGVFISILQLANKFINPNALLIGQKLCIPKTGNRFISESLNVNFNYPINWRMISENRYEGVDGFFQVGAVSGENIDLVCQNEAFHKLMPYGSSPTVLRSTMQGQPSCLIFPYPDQPPEMRGQSAFIIRYPRPITISGTTYNFFVLYADQDHIREIANTVTFLTV